VIPPVRTAPYSLCINILITPPGYGYHGDFITGWDEAFLQQAVDTCDKGDADRGNIQDCPIFDIQTEEEAAKCQFEVPEVLAADNCEGPADGLCGNVPIQDGPAYAKVIDGGNEETPTPGYTPPPATEPAAVPTLSWDPENPKLKPTSVDGISVLAAQPTPAGPKEVDASGEDEKPEEPEKAPTPAPTSAAPTPAAPAVTPAPVGEPADPAKGKIISTSTYTKDGVVHEVVIEEVPVYVTVEAPAAKRHAHAHRFRRDREHGILGRRHFH
jgi:hypothetical protein